MKTGRPSLIFTVVLTSFFAVLITSCQENSQDTGSEQPIVKNLSNPSGDSCAEPYLFSDLNGKVYLSWIEKIRDSAMLKFSKFDGLNWSPATTIVSGKNWFVNWADYPMMTTGDGLHLTAHFLEKSAAGTFAYDIKICTSSDSGRTWSRPVKLHGDTTNTEHGFVSMMPYGNYIFSSWLDGRNTPGSTASVSGMHGNHSMKHSGAMSLRAAVLNGSQKIEEWELDNRVCDCCQTAAAKTLNGPVVVYRDRSENETRDIAIARYVRGEWQKPAIIFADNWQIDGCPVNGPRIDAIGNDLAIAWYTMKKDLPEVKVIFSTDGGAHFTTPIRIDDGKPIGRVAIAMLDGSSAIITWMEGADIRSTRVFADGRKDKLFTVATSSVSRAAGFPQMTRSGHNLYYAWTDADSKRIKMAMINGK